MSAPNINPFVVSSPGKVIVFGEHAVVHGQPAIAAALSLRSYLLVSRKPKNDSTLTLDFPDVKLHHEWQLGSLPWAVFKKKRPAYDQHVTSLDSNLVEALKPSVHEVSPGASTESQRIHHAAASAFLYTLLSLAEPDFPACSYTLRSTIPIASGLGSSASISVCLGMAILVQTDHVRPTDVHSSNQKARDLINSWAFVGELNIHGNPSGIDNTVATLGRAVLFKRRTPPELPSITPLADFPTLPLLLLDTKQPRSTAAEVAKVGKLRETYPSVTDCILDGIGNITTTVHNLISSTNFDAAHPGSVTKLGELIRLNHGLLATLGVSHPRLERVRELIDQQELGWSKLTGGGGGGCHFAVLNPAASHAQLRSVEMALQDEGYARYETLLGGRGVGFLDLAKEETTSAQITQDTIRNTKNALEVEAHVGITADHLAEHWQFFD